MSCQGASFYPGGRGEPHWVVLGAAIFSAVTPAGQGAGQHRDKARMMRACGTRVGGGSARGGTDVGTSWWSGCAVFMSWEEEKRAKGDSWFPNL